MALCAGDSHVSAGQRKFGKRVVIESRGLPRRRGVATLASLRKSCLQMVRVGRLLEVGKMAAHASGGRPGELASEMTGRAIQRNMRSRQRKPGDFQMVKLGSEPGVYAVALFAGRGQTDSHMTGTGGGLIILRMAGIALGG